MHGRNDRHRSLMYKIIVSDMDETFLAPGHRIPAANLTALARLRELGIPFVPSSGRGYVSIMDNFEGVDPSLMEGSYVLSYNGAYCNRFGDPEPIFATTLDHDVADEMWRLGVAQGLCMHAYTPEGRVLVRDCSTGEAEYLSSLKRVEVFNEPTLDAIPVVSKMLFMSQDFAWLQTELADVVRPLLGGVADMTFSSGRYLEVIPAGNNKGTGLLRLAKLLGIAQDETIAMGDSANDLEMIKVAGLGVGVANASPDIIGACDLILSSRDADGALAELVTRIIEPQRA